MDIAKKIKTLLIKLQNLPEDKKKIVLWTIVAVLAVIMGFFWIRTTIDRVSKFNGEMKNIEIPNLDISNMPSLDILKTTTPSN